MEYITHLKDNEIIIGDYVYDLDKFAKLHPGGAQMLSIFGGKDATPHYYMLHQHLELRDRYLASCKVHELRELCELRHENNKDNYTINSGAYQDLKRRIRKVVPYTFATWEWYVKAFSIMATNIALEVCNLAYGYNIYRSIALGINMAMIGLCIQHDANHGAVSPNCWVNVLWGYTQDWIGGSSLLWKHHHVLLHHAYTNIVGEDPDASSDIIRLHRQILWKPMHKYQALYTWFLLPLLPLKWHFAEIYDEYTMHHMGVHISPRARKEALFGIFLRICFLIRFYAIPLYIRPHYTTFAHILLTLAVGGMYLGMNFIISHNFVGTNNIMQKNNKDWAFLQVDTSSTVGGRLLGFFHGGLNYQIEHHLFPRISHVHYHKMKPVVQQWALDYDVKYTYFNTIFDNLISCYRYMQMMSNQE